MKKIVILIFLFFVTGCSERVYSRDIFVMDTYVNVKVYSNKDASLVLDEVNDLFNYYHKLFDRYNKADINNIYTINNSGSTVVDDDLVNLLTSSLELYEDSNGLLDITMGKVIDTWKEAIVLEELPKYDDLLNFYNSRKDFSIVGNTVSSDGVFLDVGAVAKGYAIAKVSAFLEEKGYSKYLINAGGQVSAGKSYKKGGFRVGIKDPLSDSTMLVLNLENKSLSTSGDYERYFEKDGVNYNHIISPKTLFPVNYMKSVSVITDDAFLADALTTILFLMPIEDGIEFIKKYEAEAIFYSNEGEIIKTPGVSAYE